MAVLYSALIKSCIWLTYGLLKSALPIVVSHIIGLFMLCNIFLVVYYHSHASKLSRLDHAVLFIPVTIGTVYERAARLSKLSTYQTPNPSKVDSHDHSDLANKETSYSSSDELTDVKLQKSKEKIE